ncbi:MAG: hypothetical protein KTR16_15290 [Acidiferrobacterales bacterium]|nr:hypothetical protein [Acidiferrobacterales bacterium]
MYRYQIRARYFLGLIVLLLNSACATYEYHETRANQLDQVNDSESMSAEKILLDVGVVLFESGVDEYDEESIAYANVRRSEAVWFSDQLKKSLERSNAWGIVRTLPNATTIFDLTVKGQILESNGEDLYLQIEAYDAVGNQWLSKDYYQRASKYAYHPEIELNRDPFQNLFNDISNDLFALRQQYSEEQLRRVREVARIRFAQEFSPDAFAGYLSHDEQQGYQLLRLPAETDPSVQRIERIKARNDLFLDVIQDYYRIFNNNMSAPYDEWRKLSYKEVLYQRQLAKQAKQERVAGVAIILSGVLAATGGNSTPTRAAGHVGISAGADLFAKSYNTETEASLHAETLREFGESLEVELEPSVIDLQDRTVTLTGTVEDQYKEWKKILRDMYEAEQTISNPDTAFNLDKEAKSTVDVSDEIAQQESTQPISAKDL